MTEIKSKYLETVVCPYCGKPLEIYKEVEIIIPAQKAEKEERYIVNRSVQSQL